jgi:hypothetical protein
MNRSVLEILWSYRLAFLTIAIATFIISAVAILVTPQNYIVRSSVELASRIVRGKPETLESADQIAKEVVDTYLPAGLIALSQKRDPSELASFQNLKVEAVGRILTIQGASTPILQDRSKELQQFILDRIIEDQQAVTQSARAKFDVRLESARRRVESRAQSIKIIEAEIDRTQLIDSDLRKQVPSLQQELSQKTQSSAAAKTPEEAVSLEPQIRAIREQLRAITEFSNYLDLKRLSLDRDLALHKDFIEELFDIIADNERQLTTFSQVRILLPPSTLPTPAGRSRILLLAGAAIASLLISVWAIVAFRRVQLWRAESHDGRIQ